MESERVGMEDVGPLWVNDGLEVIGLWVKSWSEWPGLSKDRKAMVRQACMEEVLESLNDLLDEDLPVDRLQELSLECLVGKQLHRSEREERPYGVTFTVTNVTAKRICISIDAIEWVGPDEPDECPCG